MPVSVSRLTHAYVKKFGLKMNKFIQHDNNTWYLFNGQRYRAWEVEANPEILGYSTDPTEKNKTAQTLFDQAVIKVPATCCLSQLGSRRKGVVPKVTQQISTWIQIN